jgi:excinuclease ABC subunit B
MFVDESHISLPQVRGCTPATVPARTCWSSTASAALGRDNRPLTFAEFERMLNQVIFVRDAGAVRAGALRADRPAGDPADRADRPGDLGPPTKARSTTSWGDQLAGRPGPPRLVTTLTKRMARTSRTYLKEAGSAPTILHSEIDTWSGSRSCAILRLGIYDVVVGINLLREGLDLPEVSLVAILDADKEGFLARRVADPDDRPGARHVDGRS